MAHFMGTLKGNRGGTSRLGSKKSGVTARLNGWDFGVTVELVHQDGQDVAHVYLTSGSNGNNVGRKVGEFTADDLHPMTGDRD